MRIGAQAVVVRADLIARPLAGRRRGDSGRIRGLRLLGIDQPHRDAQAVVPIAGRFKVLRIEVGGLQMPLRQIITLQLERFLEKIGVDYTFPTADKDD